jgi:hypothetical protein
MTAHACGDVPWTSWAGGSVSIFSTRGLMTIRSLRTIATGHAFVQNLRRGHYEITADQPVHDRVRVAFTELAPCM